MRKIITATQWMGWFYIFCLEDMTKNTDISLSQVMLNAFVTLCIIGALQVMKKGLTRYDRKRI